MTKNENRCIQCKRTGGKLIEQRSSKTYHNGIECITEITINLVCEICNEKDQERMRKIFNRLTPGSFIGIGED